MQPIIKSERLTLREIEISDVNEKYVLWINNPAVNRFLESRFTLASIDTLTEYVNKQIHDPNTIFFAIIENKHSEHIGNIKLGPINRMHQRGEIGIIIGEQKYWGKGYGTAAIDLLKHFAFTSLKLHKLTSGCYSLNEASIKSFKNCGFEVEGIRKSHYLYSGKYVDHVLLGCINPLHADQDTKS